MSIDGTFSCAHRKQKNDVTSESLGRIKDAFFDQQDVDKFVQSQGKEVTKIPQVLS